jgi:hypothetical protein
LGSGSEQSSFGERKRPFYWLSRVAAAKKSRSVKQAKISRIEKKQARAGDCRERTRKKGNGARMSNWVRILRLFFVFDKIWKNFDVFEIFSDSS